MEIKFIDSPATKMNDEEFFKDIFADYGGKNLIQSLRAKQTLLENTEEKLLKLKPIEAVHVHGDLHFAPTSVGYGSFDLSELVSEIRELGIALEDVSVDLQRYGDDAELKIGIQNSSKNKKILAKLECESNRKTLEDQINHLKKEVGQCEKQIKDLETQARTAVAYRKVSDFLLAQADLFEKENVPASIRWNGIKYVVSLEAKLESITLYSTDKEFQFLVPL